MKRSLALFIIFYTLLIFILIYTIYPKYHFFGSGFTRCNKITGTIEIFQDESWHKPDRIGFFLPKEVYNLPEGKPNSSIDLSDLPDKP